MAEGRWVSWEVGTNGVLVASLLAERNNPEGRKHVGELRESEGSSWSFFSVPPCRLEVGPRESSRRVKA